MKISDAVRNIQTELENIGIKSARLDAELLLLDILEQTKEWLITHQDYILSDQQLKKLEGHIKRRINREPVCYITNKIEFYGIDLYIDNRALSPRVETEAIVEQAIKYAPANSQLLDIGTGSGAIAIAIAQHRADLQITATDISIEALEVAKINAKNILGNQNKISFVESDIWNNILGRFDTIVTNLPYVSEDYKPHMKPEVSKEPAIALFGGAGDGLSLYRRFYKDLNQHTTPGSLIYHESDPWQHEALKALAVKARLQPIFEDYLILGFEVSATDS